MSSSSTFRRRKSARKPEHFLRELIGTSPIAGRHCKTLRPEIPAAVDCSAGPARETGARGLQGIAAHRDSAHANRTVVVRRETIDVGCARLAIGPRDRGEPAGNFATLASGMTSRVDSIALTSPFDIGGSPMTRPRLSIAQLMAIVLLIGLGIAALVNNDRKNRKIANLSARVARMEADASRKVNTLLTVIVEMRDRLERPANPLPPDVSVGWSPSSTMVRFALLGSLDIDHDGKDDRNEIKRMIQDAGGAVDFDLPPPDVGTETGRILPRIDWYVIDGGIPLRESPSSKSEESLLREARFAERMGKVIKEARGNGIRPLKLGTWWPDPKSTKSAAPGGRSARASAASSLPSPPSGRAE